MWKHLTCHFFLCACKCNQMPTRSKRSLHTNTMRRSPTRRTRSKPRRIRSKYKGKHEWTEWSVVSDEFAYVYKLNFPESIEDTEDDTEDVFKMTAREAHRKGATHVMIRPSGNRSGHVTFLQKQNQDDFQNMVPFPIRFPNSGEGDSSEALYVPIVSMDFLTNRIMLARVIDSFSVTGAPN